ncbi:MAG: TlpA family protein disulfide reductase [Culturomica sp.]|jgi:thiol-disulfide isomerase/thioredoxin|nr:TlpA family protein disulfide reductase [Culturomica sp.]
MKNLLFFAFLVFWFGSCTSSETLSVIDGTWERGKPGSVKLFRTENGQMKEISSYQPDETGKFYFAFAPEKEAFYTIGIHNRNVHSYVFYFKPGDRLSVVINDTSYTLTGKNTPENVEMERWHNYVFPLERKSLYFQNGASTYVDFFPELTEKEGKYKQEYTSNATFNKAFQNLQQYDMTLYAVNFLFTPRRAHPAQSEYPDFYSRVDIPALTTAGLLDYPGATPLLRALRMFGAQQAMKGLSAEEKQAQGARISSVKNFLSSVSDDTLKGEIVLEEAATLKSYPGVIAFEEQYGKYLITESQKKRFEDIRNSVANFAQGQPAIDFTFPDINGKKVSLSDFKGKIVYVDVWATWCGPCKAEIPHLKKLEKEYHNKDVVFLSVSTDKEKDKQKWLDFVKAEALSGVQIFGGDQAGRSLMTPYKITSIPRFMLFDRAGNIITTDALRPSSPEIRPILDAALKGK